MRDHWVFGVVPLDFTATEGTAGNPALWCDRAGVGCHMPGWRFHRFTEAGRRGLGKADRAGSQDAGAPGLGDHETTNSS